MPSAFVNCGFDVNVYFLADIRVSQFQSPIHPNYKARLHLPLTHQDFFMGSARGRVEVRANFYDDEEFATTTKDTYFDIRPQYGDEA